MTKTLDQVFHEEAKEFFAQQNITVTDDNRKALYKLYKSHRLAGFEIKRTQEYLSDKVDDFYHPDREEANIKVNAAMAMIGNAVNGSCVLEDVFQEMFQFNTGHRLIDRNVLNLMLNLIKFIGKEDNKHFYVDGRNEYAQKMCKELKSAMGY